MGMFNRWRRTVITTVLCVAATTLGLGPARAAVAEKAPDCRSIQQVYGVTRNGALVQHEYCLESGQPATLATRQITDRDWASGGEIFSGRYDKSLASLPSVVYQVSRSGALLWYSDQGRGGSLGQGVAVGEAFGDWRRFRSLFSPGQGRIYGIDTGGRVVRWKHLGWLDGSDVWEGPEVVGTGFGRSRGIVGVAETGGSVGEAQIVQLRFVGVDRADPGVLRSWHQDGQEICDRRVPIQGTAGSGPLTWSGSAVGYGRSWTGRILRLERKRTEPEWREIWVASELDTAAFTHVFAGGIWRLRDPQPYEWQ